MWDTFTGGYFIHYCNILEYSPLRLWTEHLTVTSAAADRTPGSGGLQRLDNCPATQTPRLLGTGLYGVQRRVGGRRGQRFRAKGPPGDVRPVTTQQLMMGTDKGRLGRGQAGGGRAGHVHVVVVRNDVQARVVPLEAHVALGTADVARCGRRGDGARGDGRVKGSRASFGGAGVRTEPVSSSFRDFALLRFHGGDSWEKNHLKEKPSCHVEVIHSTTRKTNETFHVEPTLTVCTVLI